MSNDPHNILTPENNSDGKKELLNDLNEELDAGHAFDIDATEGLQELPHEKIPAIVHHLNSELNKTINYKKKRRQLPDQSGVYIAIIIILLLIAVTYIIIRKYMH